MSTITQVQCDIETCSDNAAFTGVETTVKSSATDTLIVKKMDLCGKHKQELLNLTPIVEKGTKFSFAHTNAIR